MRSVVQGLDSRESWERYFRVDGEATVQRIVRARIAWIREGCAAAAKREDRFSARSRPWLNPTLASHLEAADIFTLSRLVGRINGVGRRWYAGVKAMEEGAGDFNKIGGAPRSRIAALSTETGLALDWQAPAIA